MSDIGRVQWSRYGVTVYDPKGGMLFKLEHPAEVMLLNTAISIVFEKIREERKRMKEEIMECRN